MKPIVSRDWPGVAVASLALVAAAWSAAPLAAQTADVPAGQLSAEQLTRQEEARLRRYIATAADMQAKAREQAATGRAADLEAAIATLDEALESLGAPNLFTEPTVAAITADKLGYILALAEVRSAGADWQGARGALDLFRAAGGSVEAFTAAMKQIDAAERNPALLPAERVSPEFLGDEAALRRLILQGRSQYVVGDLDGAEATFRRAEIINPESLEVKGFLFRIAEDRQRTGEVNRLKARADMLGEISRSWQRPGILVQGPEGAGEVIAPPSPLAQKLDRIVFPNVSFNNTDLGRVVTTLSTLSEEYDNTGIGTKGVNLLLLDPEKRNPSVTISLRNLSMRRVLEFITQTANFQFEVQEDVVVLKPAGIDNASLGLETAFFPVPASAVSRMTGASAAGATGGGLGAPAAPVDPFAAPIEPVPSFAPAGPGGGQGAAIRTFLQGAGVNFTSVQGSNVVYDGAQLIVTQTRQNIERIRTILNRYTDVKQVEIEAKFLEVSEGTLDELGFSWSINNTRAGDQVIDPTTGFPVLDASGNPVYDGTQTFETFGPGGTAVRNLAQTVSGGLAGSLGLIIIPGIDQAIPNVSTAPSIPGNVDVGNNANDLINIQTSVGDFDVSAIVRALSRKSGTDLISSPKVTVLSGNPANIVVAQEFIYPGQYSEAQSNVSSGGGGDGDTGNAGVTITAATPQDFQTRNVGVELNVTPTVEEDDYSISLDLNPRVTEFEGFVEYGGASVAISGGTVVTTPSGIYQPIFSTRTVSTRTTVWDGATVVIGGLTREEVRRVDDKVPFLGDIPLVGRLFRSEGEASQKRNLLIFVTANLVSPGGSPKRQELRGVAPGSLFQNPTVVTPGGSASRRVVGAASAPAPAAPAPAGQ